MEMSQATVWQQWACAAAAFQWETHTHLGCAYACASAWKSSLYLGARRLGDGLGLQAQSEEAPRVREQQRAATPTSRRHEPRRSIWHPGIKRKQATCMPACQSVTWAAVGRWLPHQECQSCK